MKTFLAVCAMSSASVAFAQPGAQPAAPEVQPDGPAGAELPRRPDATPDPTTQPGFVVIDQIDASSGAGFQLSYLGLDGDLGEDLPTVLRAAVHGRYVSPELGVGGYLKLPFTYARRSSGTMSETITDVGDLELGGIYSPRINQPGTGVILRAGITLPTGERRNEATVGLIGSFLTLSDIYNVLPGGTTLKLGMSPVVRSGVVFARADLGFDWNFDAADNGVFGKILHFSAGIGAELGPAAIMFESENATLFSDSEGGNAATLDAVAVSARYTVSGVSPYVAVTVPIEDDLSELYDYAVTAGVEIRR